MYTVTDKLQFTQIFQISNSNLIMYLCIIIFNQIIKKYFTQILDDPGSVFNPTWVFFSKYLVDVKVASR